METLVGPAGRNVLDFQPIHAGHRRPTPNFFKELVYETFFPFHEDLYGRIGKIPDTSCQSKLAGGPLHKVSEPDPLNCPVDENFLGASRHARFDRCAAGNLVGARGFEPPTLRSRTRSRPQKADNGESKMPENRASEGHYSGPVSPHFATRTITQVSHCPTGSRCRPPSETGRPSAPSGEFARTPALCAWLP